MNIQSIKKQNLKYLHLGIKINYIFYRWIYCLLIREFTLKLGIRIFDTYIAEENF